MQKKKPMHIQTVLCIILLFTGTVTTAQTISGPTNLVDTPIGPVNNGGSYLNSDMIDYTPYAFASGLKNQLSAIVVEETSTGTSQLIIRDGVNKQINTTIHGVTPDVIITNDINNPGSNAYYISVVYAIKTGGGCGAYDIYLDVYLAKNVGVASALSVSAVYIGIKVSNGAATAMSRPRIDGITSYSSTFFPSTSPRPLPPVDGFAISFTDDQPTLCSTGLSNPQYGISLLYSKVSYVLANPSAPWINTVNDPTPFLVNVPQHADVAAVEHSWSGSPSDYVIAAIVDAGGNLWRYEWDPIGSSLSSNLTASGISDDMPVIAAIDNYNYNTISPITTYYMIATDNNPTGSSVIEFDPYNGSQVLTTATNTGRPAITCGPGQNYTIGYDKDVTSTTWDFISAELNWAAPSLPSIFYRLNAVYMPNDPILMPTIAATNNNDGTFIYPKVPYLLGAWRGTAHTDVYTKTEKNNSLFKTAEEQGILSTEGWDLWPNPANNTINLQTGNIAAGDSYQVTDILGRVSATGQLNGRTEQINVAALPAGVYLLHINAKGKEVKSMKFVKE